MKPPFVRQPYNYDTNKAGDEDAIACKDPTLTQQHFKEECDINTIVDRFGLSGELPQVLDLPTHGDYTGIFDYQTAMNTVVKARETFMQMPAHLRSRFHNDPQEFLAFCDDIESHKDEAKKLGLLKEMPDVTPQPPTTNATGGVPTPPATPPAPASGASVKAPA